VSQSQLIGGAISIVVVLAVFAFRFRQMSRSTPFNPGLAVLYPIFFAAFGAWFAYITQPQGLEWLWIAIALVVGGGLGWLRASTVTMSVDPATGRLMAQGSAVAIAFLVVLFVIRTVLRMVLTAEAGALHMRLIMADVIFFALAVGLLAARSLEMSLRGRKLLAAHRANPAIETAEQAGV